MRPSILLIVAALSALTASAVTLALMPAPVIQRVPSIAPGAATPREAAVITLFDQSRDAVVSIQTAQRVRGGFARNAFEVPRGSGSGFFWDAEGHVVTNDHVLRGASSATVRLADGSAHPARLVGRSPAHDLAVLRIEAPGQPLPQGAAEDVRVGQSVFAIGNPFGLDWTLTTGIVSALGRELPAEGGRTIEGLIQTDAAINPGNSGGPLLDSSGRLIGVNTAIYSPSGSSAGIGFAVPVDTVQRVVPRLITEGEYRPPTLGISADDRLSAALGQRLGVTGVAILRVVPGSPAEAAGLRAAEMTEGAIRPGDILVEVDGRPVATIGDVQTAMDGATGAVPVTIWRAGETRRLTVTL